MTSVLRNYVEGKWVEGGRTFANINALNGTKVCDVCEAASELAAAISSEEVFTDETATLWPDQL